MNSQIVLRHVGLRISVPEWGSGTPGRGRFVVFISLLYAFWGMWTGEISAWETRTAILGTLLLTLGLADFGVE